MLDWPTALALGLSTLALVLAGGCVLLLTRAGRRVTAMIAGRKAEPPAIAPRELLVALHSLQTRQKELEKRLTAVARAQAHTAGQLQLLVSKLQRSSDDSPAEGQSGPPQRLH